MKRVLNLILFIPKMIFSFVLNLFWGLFKTILFFALVIFGLLYYANHSDSQLANQISTLASSVSSYFANTSTDDFKTALSELTTDDFTYYSGSRWKTNSATVYIETSNPTLITAYEEAIANWNATGAFTLTRVYDNSQADIIATEYSDSSSQAAGLAEMETNSANNHLISGTVKLNTYYLLENDYGYTLERIIHTAEHELGHAIGLAHDDTNTSVMESAGSYHGIQYSDILALETLYSQ